MKPVLLAFGGRIASGKSTISQHVAAVLNWPWVSFGTYIRTEAHRRGLDESREALQQVSDQLIAAGWEPFCRTVLAQAQWHPGQSLIIDGIRHGEVLRTLRDLAMPQPVLFVFIDVPELIRAARIETRGIIPSEQLSPDRHASEAQVHTTLPQLADLRIDGTGSVTDLTQDIIRWLEQYMRQALLNE